MKRKSDRETERSNTQIKKWIRKRERERYRDREKQHKIKRVDEEEKEI